MWNPFKKDPPPPMFDPFEVEETIARCDAKIAEMGAAETRLIKATQRANNATKEANQARVNLDQSVEGARRQMRGTGGRKW
jgi:hypothetical protein